VSQRGVVSFAFASINCWEFAICTHALHRWSHMWAWVWSAFGWLHHFYHFIPTSVKIIPNLIICFCVPRTLWSKHVNTNCHGTFRTVTEMQTWKWVKPSDLSCIASFCVHLCVYQLEYIGPTVSWTNHGWRQLSSGAKPWSWISRFVQCFCVWQTFVADQ
jgi:hypothetical protein